jgi:hypothetical protein
MNNPSSVADGTWEVTLSAENYELVFASISSYLYVDSELAGLKSSEETRFKACLQMSAWSLGIIFALQYLKFG